MNEIYLDHAATTYVDERVLEAMAPFFGGVFANPSSFHMPGLRAKEAVGEARKTIADVLHAHEDEILFTSGGTESDNMAVLGISRACAGKGRHVITTAIEHPAVLEPLLFASKRKEIELTILPVDRFGLVNPQAVIDALRPDTVLVSVMYANNEIGTVQPIAEIGRAILRSRSVEPASRCRSRERGRWGREEQGAYQ
jgi:cysteine desulfurase